MTSFQFRAVILNLTIIQILNCFRFSVLALVLASCGTQLKAPEHPCPIPLCISSERVGLALVLGGGGAKGMAHVGVLEEFERAGIPIDIIVGCSAGSIVGALYADCPRASHVKHLLRPLKCGDVLDIDLISARFGLVKGRFLCQFLKRHLHSQHFEGLHIPLYVVATDILAGESVCLSSGPLVPAVHASCAIPLIFSPVYHYERWLVDGCVADPVPVSMAKDLGAELVVAVSLGGLFSDAYPTNLFGVARRSAEITFQLLAESCIQGADVVISPELGSMGLFDDHNPEAVYEAGRTAAREALPEIIDLLSERGLYPSPPPF
jgi:NTE family protein